MTEWLTSDPNAVWPDLIPEISTEDPVLGGKTGPVNIPHQLLVDRTEWLKTNKTDNADFEAHAGSSAAHNATSAAAPDQIIRRDENGRAKIATPAQNDEIANKSYVDTSVNNIQGGASQTDLANHVNATAAHSATNAATANRIIMRDSAGRAKITAPAQNDDIANMGYVLNALNNLTTGGGGGMTYGGKVTITASQSQSDPSQGRGRLFRITIVGAGGGGCNGTGSYGGGGGGETIIKVIPYTDISWPIYITVGQGTKNGNGGSTSFGSLITAYGGRVSIHSNYGGVAGGFEAGRASVLFIAPHGNYNYQKFHGGSCSVADSSYTNTGDAIYVTGGGGDAYTGANYNGKGGSCFPYPGGVSNGAGGGGASLFGAGGAGSYDSQAGDGGIGGGGGAYGGYTSWAAHQSYVGKGGNGVCIIEWFE